jgi:hypothetical protein
MNGNDAERIGIQSQRITNLETVFGEFRREFSHQIGAVNASVSAIQSKMDERFNALTSSLAERNRPQYQALGFALSVILAVGALAYWPIRESTNDLKANDVETARIIQSLATETNKTIQNLAANTVSRQEMDWRAARGIEDRDRTTQAITDLRVNAVARSEWSERNRASDQQMAELSRRMEELRSDFGAVYGTRDVIKDMKQEIDALRQRIATQRYSRAPP